MGNKQADAFIAKLYPAAVEASKATGMSWELMLAQAAAETGWGKHTLAGTNNLFNIKADKHWDGPSKVFHVWEIKHGEKVFQDDAFRVYKDYAEAFKDRAEFLQQNPRYAKAGLLDAHVKGNLAAEAKALQKAGYATDPDYAEKLVKVFNGPTMRHALEYARKVTHDASNAGHVQEKHEDIGALQKSLNTLGYHGKNGQPLAQDGQTGPQTEHAIRAFQKDHHLQPDGVVGPLTQSAISHAMQQNAERHHPQAEAAQPQGLMDSLRSAWQSLSDKIQHACPRLDAQENTNATAYLAAKAQQGKLPVEAISRVEYEQHSQGKELLHAVSDVLGKFVSADVTKAIATPAEQTLTNMQQQPEPTQQHRAAMTI